jgi:hypothetical protein
LEIEVRNGEREAIISEMESHQLDYEDTGGIIQVFHSDADRLVQEFGGFSWNLWTRLATLEDVFFRLTGRALVE